MSRQTVSITLPDDEYAQLKELAEEQDRYISGQARHMLRVVLHNQALVRNINAKLAEAPEYRPETNPDDPLVTGDESPDATLGELARSHPTLSPEELLGKVKEHQPAAHQNPTAATSKTLPG
jgi:hypothetical protein